MGVTDDRIDDYDSVELVNIVSEVMKGKGGGGRRDMALAGGTDIDMVDEAKKTLIMKIKNKS
jgi:alanyl-tRNA synthetase